MNEFKLAHLSDLHLGYTSGKKKVDEMGMNVREQDGYDAYNKCVDQIIKEKVDAVLIAGDMFHSPRPKNHTIVIAQEGLRKIAAANIPVYIIAGNHDATDVRAEVPSSVLLNEPNNNIFSFSKPYLVKEIDNGIYMHFLGHHAYVDQQETFKEIEIVDNAINILASHGSCYDSNMGMILRTPNEPREVVIPEEVMEKNWDYTLLGHIHERGWIGSKDRKTDTEKRKQFYNGSLIRRGFADKVSPNGRGWTLWTINKDTKEFQHKFFTIKERTQLDMEPIDVQNKKTIEIEKEIIEQLEEIDNMMEEKYGEINVSNAPIVRQTLVGVDAITRLALNLQRFNEYTSKYLSHNFRIIQEKENLNANGEISLDTVNNSDIVAVFNEWTEKREEKKEETDKETKEKIEEAARQYLKESRDELLTKED